MINAGHVDSSISLLDTVAVSLQGNMALALQLAAHLSAD